MNVDELVAKLKGNNPEVRADAWRNAAQAGAVAILPVAGLMASQDVEVVRAAQRALWTIVRHAGQPGAEAERKPVVNELLKLLASDHPRMVRADGLWMLSEIADEESVPAVARLLRDNDMCEDARLALQRIPGIISLAALKDAMEQSSGRFKSALAVSLRQRGMEVPGVPDDKLVPCKVTAVKSSNG